MNRKTALKICISVVIFVLVVGGAFWGATTVRYYFFRPLVVRGDSMAPTILPDTLHYVDTTATPRCGDVAVFYYAEDGAEVSTKTYFDTNAYLRSMPIWGMRIADTSASEHDLLVKRVVAVGGDTVELRAETVDGVNFVCLYRNGQKVPEDVVMLNVEMLDEATIAYAQSLYDRYGRESSHGVRPVAAYTVPEGYVYVLGDNRDDSTDSRRFGPVPLGNFVGVVR